MTRAFLTPSVTGVTSCINNEENNKKDPGSLSNITGGVFLFLYTFNSPPEYSSGSERLIEIVNVLT